jgi:WhiB family transcriptional regulator, redox-sensing transcriptional regulator
MSWEAHAACQDDVAALFFPPEGERRPERELREKAAKAICAACPVRRQCLECAMSANIRDGLWGGLSEDERRRERRNRARRGRAAEGVRARGQGGARCEEITGAAPTAAWNCDRVAQ